MRHGFPMNVLVTAAWFALGLLHLLPAASAFAPSLLERLYGVTPSGDLAVVLAHRGVLFGAIVIGCAFGVFDPAARRVLSVIVGFSIVGYLLLYLRADTPAGPLRKIALADAAGLLPWAAVLWDAWAHRAA
jgi:hypothetical protein